MVADGMSRQEILSACPDLQDLDIDEPLQFAAEAVRERPVPILSDALNFSSITLCRMKLRRY